MCVVAIRGKDDRCRGNNQRSDESRHYAEMFFNEVIKKGNAQHARDNIRQDGGESAHAEGECEQRFDLKSQRGLVHCDRAARFRGGVEEIVPGLRHGFDGGGVI